MYVLRFDAYLYDFCHDWTLVPVSPSVFLQETAVCNIMMRGRGVILSLLSLVFITSAQHIAFDCTAEESNYTTISLLSVGDCIYKEDEFVEEDVEIQLLQQKESNYISTYSCLINLNYMITYCGMSSHNSLVHGGIVSHVYAPTEHECKTMHSYRKASVYGINIPIPRFNETFDTAVTFAGSVSSDGTCEGGYYNLNGREYHNVLAHGYVKVMIATGLGVRMIPNSTHNTQTHIDTHTHTQRQYIGMFSRRYQILQFFRLC